MPVTVGGVVIPESMLSGSALLKKDTKTLPKAISQPTQARAFEDRYYSGIDVSVYFGPTLIEEAVSIQWQLVENVLPLYGYHRYTFQKVARGTRVVQGTFTLNFQNPTYIDEVIATAINGDPESVLAKQQGLLKTVPAQTYRPASFYGFEEVANSSSGNSTAKALKDAYWGQITSSVDNNSSSTITINRPRFTGSPARSFINTMKEADAGFPITIKFDKKELDFVEIDYIVKNMGQTLPKEKKEVPIQTLTNVHITNMSESIDDSGQAVVNVFSFIGSDVVGGWATTETQLPR